eukprot:gene4305-14717_t
MTEIWDSMEEDLVSLVNLLPVYARTAPISVTTSAIRSVYLIIRISAKMIEPTINVVIEKLSV